MPSQFTIVTGGSNGIGAGICRHLLASGSAVANVDKVPPAKAPDGEYVFFKADLSQPAETRQIAAEVLRKYPIENLVNNAGVSLPGDLEDVTEDDFTRTMNLHLQAAIIFAQ